MITKKDADCIKKTERTHLLLKRGTSDEEAIHAGVGQLDIFSPTEEHSARRCFVAL